jgi:hypothetical protein
MAAKPKQYKRKFMWPKLSSSSRFFSNKNETMFGSGYENCPEFGVLGGVIFKLDIL